MAYFIKHNNELNILEITNNQDSISAKIMLGQGASLQELKLKNHGIIKDLSPLPYSDTYASSILFPFANRINRGYYVFNGEEFQLYPNNEDEGNALHGLIYDKTFEILECQSANNFALLSLRYIEPNLTKGFPYSFAIEVEYRFQEDQVELAVSAKNTSNQTFPFTIGWHPYFESSNLYESSIAFKSNKQLESGDRNIGKALKTIETIDDLEIKDLYLDDCWKLLSDEIVFKTPNYNLLLKSSAQNNFLQVYTPKRKNTVAIEPTTGVSDSFNNKIGLQVLKPAETYTITWTLQII